MNTFVICISHLQSGYFSSMFRGSWKESMQREITISIPDENIDVDGNYSGKIFSKFVF